jgi:hypothetical protein
MTRARSSVGVERLEHEVLGAQLDAADHRLDLIERGNDHDRQIVDAAALLEPLEDAESVQFRHHDIEKHEVEILALDRRQGLDPVGRLLHVVDAQALEPAHEQVPVLRHVVNDQHGGVGRFAHGAARRAPMLRGVKRWVLRRAGPAIRPGRRIAAKHSRAPAAEPSDARANPGYRFDGRDAREGTCRDACQDAGGSWAGNPRYTPGHGVGKLRGPPLTDPSGTPGARRGRMRQDRSPRASAMCVLDVRPSCAAQSGGKTPIQRWRTPRKPL